ncbi:MAG TPA: CocE/NonD family hydrolase [Candidatus Limnocylindrales bacterium]|nr:CocE/NonD family hydrolase [Candidatus Limnocylindrales bacterium]
MPEERPASQPVHAVRSERDVRIRARDGVELSANLWLPAGASPASPAPAILEMIPYRKDDWRSNADEARGRYLAARGYVLCRLDVRGTGRSDGVALDEYTADETRDGYDAVEWLAAQPWSNGNVGMWGISYGGFTSIQVAALRPPHLRAIVPMYATDDRYTDDVHYVGGCATASELTQYAVSQVASNALPALPARPGEDWIAAWRERLAATPVWLIPWLRHQRDGPYWRRGSLAPDYARIEAAILMFGGWMDSYVDPVFRMLERCGAPRRAIVGNWSHEYPDDGYPGPGLDWLHEMIRFLDHWLKGEPNGTMDEPGLAWFQRDVAPPEPFPRTWPGRWRATAAWPPPDARRLVLWLGEGPEPLHGVLAAGPTPPGGSAAFRHRATTGTGGGLSWGAGSPPNGLARDVRVDEAGVPVFTSGPLEAPIEVLGPPELVVRVEASMPVATLVVRLSDVAPDGVASQVTMGILNLTHRRSHEAPERLVPGAVETVRVPLRAAGYRFAAGHRIRVSVASACWPVIWPSPYPGTITLRLGGPGTDSSHLRLPLAPATDDASPPAFRTGPPDLESIGGGTDDQPAWRVTEDVMAGTVTVSTHDGGDTITADGTRLYSAESHDMTAADADPARATMASRIRYVLERDGHAIEVDVDGETTSTVEAFVIDIRLAVRLDGEPFHDARTTESIARDLV